MDLLAYINSELQKRLNSEAGKREVKNLIKKRVNEGNFIGTSSATFDEAISVLKECICNFAPPAFSSSEAFSTIAQMIDGSVSAPIETSNGWQINVNFNQEQLRRPSLWNGSSGAYDIIGLFSQGWNIGEDKRVPVGVWHGQTTAALRSRPGKPFVEEAVNFFMATYASQYGITEIYIDPLYGTWGIF